MNITICRKQTCYLCEMPRSPWAVVHDFTGWAEILRFCQCVTYRPRLIHFGSGSRPFIWSRFFLLEIANFCRWKKNSHQKCLISFLTSTNCFLGPRRSLQPPPPKRTNSPKSRNFVRCWLSGIRTGSTHTIDFGTRSPRPRICSVFICIRLL